MSNCSYLYPKVGALPKPVKIVNNSGLIRFTNMVKIIEHEVRIATGKLGKISEYLLIFYYSSVQKVDLVASKLFSYLLFTGLFYCCNLQYLQFLQEGVLSKKLL